MSYSLYSPALCHSSSFSNTTSRQRQDVIIAINLRSQLITTVESKNIRWIKADSPVIYDQTFLEFTGYKTVSKREETHEIRRLHFNVSGPDHMHLIVWPKPSVTLVGWSFTDSLPSHTAIWDGRPVYVINCVRGYSPAHLEVHFDLQFSQACATHFLVAF
ncbi:hypothetical protein J6590_017372 [Homalodisca vitripennis]|nr:hypothetical protein J6590_017372 [Homalodisca vitripennis]